MREELSDEEKSDLLGDVLAECARSIGFDTSNSGELTEQRERALNYVKGEMPDLVMQLKGRSKVVSTDVADAIETAMPDLIDIFTGSDDVVVFEPVAEDDIEAAQQETDYLNYVLFQRNSGWMVLYTAFKDALTCKTGVFSWRWDGEFEPPAEMQTGKSAMEMLKAGMEGVVSDVTTGEPDDMGQPTFNYEFTPKNAKGRMIIEAIASEDLAVAPDTKSLATATYCCVRSHPRAQELLALGFDPDVIDALPAWTENGTAAEAQARDTVAESQMVGGTTSDMRQVEIYRHYIRKYHADEKEWCLYQVTTGGRGYTNTLIDIEEVSRIQLAAITPFINPHRFYGDSIADKLMEIQKIKSSLMRMTLDNGYFALNQRFEVAENGMNENTLDDLLNNEPGMPVRVRSAGTINAISAGGLNYDPLSHLEYFSTVAEQRTGIVRNAQGLNPDTLHDTKGGLQILANAAQKRLRMIARTFAETGYKDFLLGLHASLREVGASVSQTVRLRGKQFVSVDPSTWRQRDDMTIAVGVGAGGREHDMIVGQQLGMIQEKLIMADQSPDGPLLNKEKVYNAAIFAIKSLGVKSPELYVADPKEFQPPSPPPPDPKVLEGQAKLQLEQQRLQQDAAKAASQAQYDQAKLQQEYDLRMADIEAKYSFERDKLAAEIELNSSQFEAELAFKREQVAIDSLTSERDAQIKSVSNDVELGGDTL